MLIFSCFYAGAQAQQFAVRSERRGNVYLIGSEIPGLKDKCNRPLADSGQMSAVCAPPVYRSNISFVFSDGDEHVYAAVEGTPATSFAVLLRGKAKLPSYKSPSWSILTWRDRAYGDTVLLQKLLTKELKRLEYSREEIRMDNGKEIRENEDAVVMKLSAGEAAQIRRKLQGL